MPLSLAAVMPVVDGPMGLPMEFDIAMGVRREDRELRAEIEVAPGRRRAEINATLAKYGVPRSDMGTAP